MLALRCLVGLPALVVYAVIRSQLCVHRASSANCIDSSHSGVCPSVASLIRPGVCIYRSSSADCVGSSHSVVCPPVAPLIRPRVCICRALWSRRRLPLDHRLFSIPRSTGGLHITSSLCHQPAPSTARPPAAPVSSTLSTRATFHPHLSGTTFVGSQVHRPPANCVLLPRCATIWRLLQL